MRVKKLHAQGKEAFVAEAGRETLILVEPDKPEAENIKDASEQDKKKRRPLFRGACAYYSGCPHLR